MLGLTAEKQNQIVTSINKHFVVIAVVLVITLFITQFVVLATVGTQGASISQIQAEKDFYRIENARLRAEIDSAKTLGRLAENEHLLDGLEQKNVEVIDAGNADLETVGYAR